MTSRALRGGITFLNIKEFPMNEQHYWLALSELPGIGLSKINNWLKTFTSVSNLFAATDSDLISAGLTPEQAQQLKNINWQQIEKNLLWLDNNQGTLLHQAHPLYPPLLREISRPPLILYVQGDPQLLSGQQLAIVGSRSPTHTGIKIAEQFASQLALAGLTITSGLARGIDGASHSGALGVKGRTIAVLGSGLQQVYPTSHRKLAEKIIVDGALISEFSLKTPPRAQHFPARNRIISGLSLGVLVVEAAKKSGSLITAYCALEQNREVFAIPGSIYNPRAGGCHRLIRDGAILVETVNDILSELKMNQTVTHKKTRSLHSRVDFAPEMQRVYKYVGYEITPLDAIIMNSSLTAGEVSSMLLRLELEGLVHTVIGGYTRTVNR